MEPATKGAGQGDVEHARARLKFGLRAQCGERCIKCTRCVRFCQEITKTNELAVVNRGDHS